MTRWRLPMTSPAVQPATRIFSAVNAAIVRGHAVVYAKD